MAKVSTAIGELDEVDLEKVLTEDDTSETTTVVARDWYYRGSDLNLAEHVGKSVRRDVWVTIKQGLTAAAINEG